MIFCMKRMYERWIRAQPPQVFIILKREMGWDGVGTWGKVGSEEGMEGLRSGSGEVQRWKRVRSVGVWCTRWDMF